MGLKELFLLLFACRVGGLGGLGLHHALLEFVDAPGCIHKLLRARIERMADVADTHQDRRPGGTGFDHVSTGATNLGLDILRMSVSFHTKRAVNLPATLQLTSVKIALPQMVWLEPVPRKRPKSLAVVDQLDRASTSIPLNIAEGNGKFTGADRCRFFDIARGSALECAASLDVLRSKGRRSEVDLIKANSDYRPHDGN